MGHVQERPSCVNQHDFNCMYDIPYEIQMFGYNLGSQKMSKSKLHILTISEPISMKPAIVISGLHILICFKSFVNGKLMVHSMYPLFDDK